MTGKTGVEMEALVAVTTAALTVYDMCKAVDREMVISDIHLVEKQGGKSGHFVWGKKDAGKDSPVNSAASAASSKRMSAGGISAQAGGSRDAHRSRRLGR